MSYFHMLLARTTDNGLGRLTTHLNMKPEVPSHWMLMMRTGWKSCEEISLRDHNAKYLTSADVPLIILGSSGLPQQGLINMTI